MIFKYVLILHLCSFVGQPQCYNPKIAPIEFNSHYECIHQGYVRSAKALEIIDRDLVNKQKLAVKFECKEFKQEKI
ncbi:hypothetical protein P120_gp46 [Pelagibacter phage HTVC120P]|nr:hypothetical protein P120_gp46 [Pelagibacter phage HTVC120P]